MIVVLEPSGVATPHAYSTEGGCGERDGTARSNDQLADDGQAKACTPEFRPRASSSLVKRSKTRSRSSGAMPGPSSLTLITAHV